MFTNNEKISSVQVKRILVLSTVGFSSMISTNIATDYGGHDGMFCILFAYLFTLIYTFFILYLCERTEWNYFAYMNKYAGRRLTNVLSLVFILKYAFLIIPGICFFVKITRSSLIQQRSVWFVMLPIVLLCLYMSVQGLEAIGRLAQCFYIITLFALILGFILNAKFIDKFYVAPLFRFTSRSIFYGSAWIFLLFFPMELILLGNNQIDADDFKKRRHIKRRCFLGITISYVLTFLYYLVNVGVLSINGIRSDSDTCATIQLLNRIRISNILLIFFLVSMFFSLSLLMYAIIKLVSRMSSRQQTIRILTFAAVYLCSIAIFLISPEFASARFTSEIRTDIENRIYTNAIILDYDYNSKEYKMSLIFSHDANKMSVTDIINTNSLENMTFEYALTSDKRLDFSHTQAILIHPSIYASPIVFQETVNYLNSLNNLNHRTLLCGIDTNSNEFIKLNSQLEIELGKYLFNLMNNNLNYAKSTLEELKKVNIETENACIISNFSIEDNTPKYIGCTVLNKNGLVENYIENDASVTNLTVGKEDFTIELGLQHRYHITDNEYYIQNTKTSSQNIKTKIIYSGLLKQLKSDGLSENEINTIFEKIIFERLTHLKDDMSCDILNTYKHLAIDDHCLYTMYSGRLMNFYEISNIEVECRFVLQ